MSEQPGTGPDEHLANVLGTVSLRVMTRVAAAVEDATGLTMVQATALSALGVHAGDVRSGASIDQLRRWVELSHSATVRLVDRLVEAGLVERRETASDRRVAMITLTVRGRGVVRRIRSVRARVLESLLADLGPHERTRLAPLLDSLAAADVVAAADPDDRYQAIYFTCRLCDPVRCGHPDRCPVTHSLRG